MDPLGCGANAKFAGRRWTVSNLKIPLSFTRYQPRRLKYLGVESVAGYLLKVYIICEASQTLEIERFAARWELAARALPQPAMTESRPGVGFTILHQGRTADYLILCWWDQENELPTRVFLRGPEGWRPAEGGESFCVWDLRVIWWEREAYVGTVLAGSASAPNAYLATVVEGYV